MYFVFAGLVFKGIAFFDVGLAVFLGRYSHLCRHLLRCGPVTVGMSGDDITQMLQDRLKPIRIRHLP